MSTDPSPDRPRKQRPDPSPDPAQILAEALPSAPPEVIDALGGAPIAVPSQAARRVVASPSRRPVVDAPGTAAAPAPGRVANPLFDDPDPAIESARKRVRQIRAALGSAAVAMDHAADLCEALIVAGDEVITRAALREGFDLDAAVAVADEFRAFLDKHKPKAPAA